MDESLKGRAKRIQSRNDGAVFAAAALFSAVVAAMTLVNVWNRPEIYTAEAVFSSDLSEVLLASRDTSGAGEALAGALPVGDPGEFADPGTFSEVRKHIECRRKAEFSPSVTCRLTLFGYRERGFSLYYLEEADLVYPEGRGALTGYSVEKPEIKGNGVVVERKLNFLRKLQLATFLILVRAVAVFFLVLAGGTVVWREHLAEKDPDLYKEIDPDGFLHSLFEDE